VGIIQTGAQLGILSFYVIAVVAAGLLDLGALGSGQLDHAVSCLHLWTITCHRPLDSLAIFGSRPLDQDCHLNLDGEQALGE
jgi:hypothetical protein